MEDEKKKKRNKKKKNKQTKLTEDVTIASEDTTSQEHNHENVPAQNHCIDNDSTPTSDGKSRMIDVEGASSTIALEKEVMRLEAEKCSWLQKEKHLEEEIEKAKKDKHLWSIKEKHLEEEIEKSKKDKHFWFIKEASLKEKIVQLENEKSNCFLKETSLEDSIKCLQSEKKSWIEKEASLEARIKQLRTELEALIMKETSALETIVNLKNINEGLQIQVKELEESRISCLKENQHLMDSISHMEHKNQSLERGINVSSDIKEDASKDEDPDSVIESARVLVEKLVIENAELVEKVNELCVKLNRLRTSGEQTPVFGLDPTVVMPTTEPSFVVSHSISEPDKMDSVATIPTMNSTIRIGNGDLKTFVEEAVQPGESYNGFGSGEIVPVPLEYDEAQQLEAGMAKSGEDGGVPLTDAPLIGAPFRLISFVAKYVSGADLVEKSG